MTFQCPHCSRDFSRRASLRNHMRTHENVIERYLQEIEEERNNPVIIDEEQHDNILEETRFDLESILDDEQLDERQRDIEYDTEEEMDIEREPNVEEEDDDDQNIEEMDDDENVEEEDDDDENVEEEEDDENQV
jgi:uncharacterized Zn-finger protein